MQYEEMKNERIDQLIAEYLSGSLTAEAFQELKSWSQQLDENRMYVRNQIEVWFSSGVTAKDKLFNKEEAFARFQKRIGKKEPKVYRFPWKTFYRVAAVILIVLLPLAGYWKGQETLRQTFSDMVTGLIPGSIGETSVIAIAIGAVILLWTGVASWKTMLSVFVGGAVMGWIFNTIGPDTGVAQMPWYEHLCLGGFCFGAVFMATDPVTSSRTENGKFVYGFLIGAMAIIIRVLNPGYPEGMMLAILLMNIFAPLIDYVVVQNNISRRAKRAMSNK